MTHLTYTEYKELGGTLEETAFNRNIDRACGIIDNATHNRIECMAEVPKKVKALCRDLVEYLARNLTSGMVVSSQSQSAGGVSESVSYATKTTDEINAEMLCIVYDYLISEKDDNGTPLMYRGAMR